MHIWPTSSTLREDGGAAPSGAPQPTGNGGDKSIFSMGAGMPAVNAGEIMLSRPESIALSALDTEPNEAHGRKRAREESGLTDAQITALQRRAKHALSKGITLKGQGYIRKPTAGPPEEPQLVRTAKAQAKEAVESLRQSYNTGLYSLPADSDYRFPAPNSMHERDDVDSVRVLPGGGAGQSRGLRTREECRRPGDMDADTEETNSQSGMSKLTSAMARRAKARRRA